MAHWKPVMRAAVTKVWKEEYLSKASQSTTVEPPKKVFSFRYWMPIYDPTKSEIDNYADGTPSEDTKTFNPIQWWAAMAGPNDFPTLSQYALDILCCPAMSAECERVFSSTKKLITPERNALADDIIEACECLKAWWKNSLIEQQEGPKPKRQKK
jgi:hypothetical protein